LEGLAPETVSLCDKQAVAQGRVVEKGVEKTSKGANLTPLGSKKVPP